MRFLTIIAVLTLIPALALGCAKKMSDSEVFDDSRFASSDSEEAAPPPPPDSGAPAGASQTPAPDATGATPTPAAKPPASGGDGKLGEMATSFGKKLTDLDTAANENKPEELQKIANELRVDFDKIKVLKVLKTEAKMGDAIDVINAKINDLLTAISQADANQITKCKNTIIMQWRPLISWMRANADASIESDSAAAPKAGGDTEKPAGEQPAGGDKPKTGGKSDWEESTGDEAPPAGQAKPKDEKPEEE